MVTTPASTAAADDIGRQAAPPESTIELSLTPLQRLERSRERLRQVLAPPPQPAADSADGSSGRSWEQRLRDIPGIGTVIDVVKVWWQQHPLHAVGIVASEVGRTTLRPIARRHPFALVGVALLAGVLLAWARPWRLALRSAMLAGLVPQVASRVVASLPIESWLTVLGTLFTKSTGSAHSAAAAEAAATEAAASSAAADSADNDAVHHYSNGTGTELNTARASPQPH